MKNEKNCSIAFFDAEFTAKTAKDRGIPEIIQCAFLIYRVKVSESGDLLDIAKVPIKTYQAFVKPIYTTQLSDYIKELTGISQQSVDDGISFKEVIDDIYSLVQKYHIDSIVTWGPDKGMLKKNFYFSDYNKKRAAEILNLFDDISFKISKMFGYEYPISQSNMCKHLHLEESGVHHDAYNDAVDLARIIQAICDS